MLLAVNIGNSNIRLGVFEPSGKINSWTIAAKPIPSHQIFQEKYLESYSLHGVEIGAITKIVVGSVVPNLNEMIINVLRKVHEIEPLLVDRDSKAKIQHTSNQMGTDLFANAVAAHEFYEGKKIVVDFGTALTFTGIDEKGKTIGVSIAPGVITSLNSLVNSTAQLPQIEIKQPPNILGGCFISICGSCAVEFTNEFNEVITPGAIETPIVLPFSSIPVKVKAVPKSTTIFLPS